MLYDAAGDRYLVSNVNGNPTARDNNGFISVLSPAGEITALKWIEAGKNGVKLDAPKGLAIVKGTLYVADISVVRTFDARTGAPRGEIPVPGSTFLSDLAAGTDGKIYLTDAGPPQGEFDGSGTEAVYVIKGNRAHVLARGSDLGRPDGLAWSADGPVVSPFGADEIYRLDAHGKRQDITKLPAGGLAGIVKLGDGFLVASWQTSSIYRGKLGGTFRVALGGQKSPADIGLRHQAVAAAGAALHRRHRRSLRARMNSSTMMTAQRTALPSVLLVDHRRRLPRLPVACAAGAGVLGDGHRQRRERPGGGRTPAARLRGGRHGRPDDGGLGLIAALGPVSPRTKVVFMNRRRQHRGGGRGGTAGRVPLPVQTRRRGRAGGDVAGGTGRDSRRRTARRADPIAGPCRLGAHAARVGRLRRQRLRHRPAASASRAHVATQAEEIPTAKLATLEDHSRNRKETTIAA